MVLALVPFFMILLTISGCDTPSKPDTKKPEPLPARNVTVEIKDFAFTPEVVTTGVKSRITWVNKDAGLHTVKGGEIDSGPLGQGDSYSYAFLKTGIYNYSCTLHPYMTGKIIVK
jgi:plastocyanin